MPNSKQVTPDPVDEDRDPLHPPNNSNNNSANNMEPEVAVGIGQPMAGVIGIPRRDENSISFRHFLQPHSDVVPSPAPTCRRSRGPQQGAVDLVDMAMALPDFVQDHLVVESLAITDHQNDNAPSHPPASSVDLALLNEILPDWQTSQSAHSLQSQAANTRRRNMPEEAPSLEGHGAAGTSALPDFLSDGPMQCTDSNVVDNTLPASSSSSRSTSRLISSASLTERGRIVDESSRGSSFDSSDTLRSEVDRLRREVLERNRRISQLENEILRLRSNVNTLENALRNAEHASANSEARIMQSQRRSENISGHVSNATVGGGDACDSAVASSSRSVNGGSAEVAEINAHVVRDIAQSSEALISQLLQNMARLQGLVGSPSHQNEGNPEKSKTGDGNLK